MIATGGPADVRIHFENLTDPRRGEPTYPLLNVVVMTLCAVISGADDFVIKPFDLNEVCARLRALARRNEGRSAPTIDHAGIMLDPASHHVTFQGEKVELSQKEFEILSFLMSNIGRVISRARLEESLYSWNSDVESNTVEVHIHHLRKKLDASVIRTVRGVGYIIDAEEEL